MQKKKLAGQDLHRKLFKGSSDLTHFIFEINVGKSRTRHSATLKLNNEFLNRLKIALRFKFNRIRLFPPMISKIKSHFRTTHVDAETYINDEDAKEETNSLLGEKFTNEIVQFIQKNLKSE